LIILLNLKENETKMLNNFNLFVVKFVMILK